MRYLYNALSLGFAALILDADVVFLRSPLPAVLGPPEPQLASLTDKCEASARCDV